jgi:hypothetical protein
MDEALRPRELKPRGAPTLPPSVLFEVEPDFAESTDLDCIPLVVVDESCAHASIDAENDRQSASSISRPALEIE